MCAVVPLPMYFTLLNCTGIRCIDANSTEVGRLAHSICAIRPFNARQPHSQTPAPTWVPCRHSTTGCIPVYRVTPESSHATKTLTSSLLSWPVQSTQNTLLEYPRSETTNIRPSAQQAPKSSHPTAPSFLLQGKHVATSSELPYLQHLTVSPMRV